MTTLQSHLRRLFFVALVWATTASILLNLRTVDLLLGTKANNNNSTDREAETSSSLLDRPLPTAATATTTTTTKSKALIPPPPPPRPGLHVVVAHCDKSLAWIWDNYLRISKHAGRRTMDVDIRSITIYSKCGQPLTKTWDLPPNNVTRTRTGTSDYYTTTIPIFVVTNVPNVGRCDHSYAHWIANQLEGPSNSSTSTLESQRRPIVRPNDVVLFIKETDNGGRTYIDKLHPLGELWKEATTTGFACGSRLRSNSRHPKTLSDLHKDYLNVAETRNLATFRMDLPHVTDGKDGGNYSDVAALVEAKQSFLALSRPLGAWVRHLQEEGILKIIQVKRKGGGRDTLALSLGPEAATSRSRNSSNTNATLVSNDVPTDRIGLCFIPICFGGNFMVRWDRILHHSPVQNWTGIVEQLSRGDNIEEGHYMERIWAAILAPPISSSQRASLLRYGGSDGKGFGVATVKHFSHQDPGFTGVVQVVNTQATTTVTTATVAKSTVSILPGGRM